MKKYSLLLLFFFSTLSDVVIGRTIENDTTKLLTVVLDSIGSKHVLENNYVRRNYKLGNVEVISEKSYDPQKHKLVIVITKLKVRRHKAIVYGRDFNRQQARNLTFIFYMTKKRGEWIFDINNKKNVITIY